MQKFKITCMKCGSDNCEIDCDDYLIITCLDCGNKYDYWDVYNKNI